MMLCIFVVFFFKDTATPEVYTYLHTLSLHDALPISRWPEPGIRSRRRSAATTPRCGSAEASTAWTYRCSAPACSGARSITDSRVATISTVLRSEEHTSELQSLMRISYAVFCLKKKKKKTYHQDITRKYYVSTN